MQVARGRCTVSVDIQSCSYGTLQFKLVTASDLLYPNQVILAVRVLGSSRAQTRASVIAPQPIVTPKRTTDTSLTAYLMSYCIIVMITKGNIDLRPHKKLCID